MGVAFDPVELELRGTPVPLLDDVASASDTAAGQFDFSRTGIFVYLSRPAPRAWPIELLEESGKMEPLAAPAAEYDTPRFSPDGSGLAVSANSGQGADIYVWDFGRGSMTRLTSNAGANLEPVWTPDGKHLVFYFPVAGGYAVGWIRADGAGGIERLLESRSLIVPYSFTPDGRRLAYFEQFPETDCDIFTVALDLTDPDHPKTGAPTPFLRTPANEQQPMFSPDGRWIAYISHESGTFEVYVRAFPGPGGSWKVSKGAGALPIWSRRERKLFYQTPDGRIMAVAYSVSGASFKSEPPRQWSPKQVLTRGYTDLDLSPDGKRFAVFPRPQDTESVHVTFLLNFFDEMARRVPGPR
jgi:serine/threonine-protein kinase